MKFPAVTFVWKLMLRSVSRDETEAIRAYTHFMNAGNTFGA